jgi:hypothetical protein
MLSMTGVFSLDLTRGNALGGGSRTAPRGLDIFHRLAQARLSRRLEPVVGDPPAPGSHRCRGRGRGRNRDRDRFL